MLPIFQKLNTIDLSSCALVCKTWLSMMQDPSLWTKVKLNNLKITPHLLSLIVQRQPTSLSLTCCQIGKQQLSWLLPRIPQTREMSLIGLDFVSSVVALSTVNTPMLQELDLSFVTSLNDGALYKILSAPRDSRPGIRIIYIVIHKLKWLIITYCVISINYFLLFIYIICRFVRQKISFETVTQAMLKWN